MKKKQLGYYGFGGDMGKAFMILLVIAAVVGWAGIELIIWLFSHIDISWKWSSAMIFPPSTAAAFKSCAGSKYRPSNGTEGELFQDAYCHRCKHDQFDGEDGESCRILLDTMAWDVEDEDYPKEWIIATDGQPTCTAFEVQREEC